MSQDNDELRPEVEIDLGEDFADPSAEAGDQIEINLDFADFSDDQDAEAELNLDLPGLVDQDEESDEPEPPG